MPTFETALLAIIAGAVLTTSCDYAAAQNLPLAQKLTISDQLRLSDHWWMVRLVAGHALVALGLLGIVMVAVQSFLLG